MLPLCYVARISQWLAAVPLTVGSIMLLVHFAFVFVCICPPSLGARLTHVIKAVPLPWVFPALLLLLNVASAAVSFYSGDPRRGVYWIASAVCIGMVAFR